MGPLPIHSFTASPFTTLVNVGRSYHQLQFDFISGPWTTLPHLNSAHLEFNFLLDLSSPNILELGHILASLPPQGSANLESAPT